uniref:Zinc finger, CCHC-type n=1 Tax=Tanacetum cinerariifolium TaxID=118510 RepID=A0A6L2N337_TANCI|nr:hypothetical protein [Tanacetum cinerariifolium]
MASMNTRLNIEKLNGNIVQKHGGLKQVGFKQLGPGVETGVHGVHDKKRVWFEVELQGDQEDHKAEVFQVSNDDTAVDQRRLKDKLPEEKTNTDCLVKEQKKEYQPGEQHSAWELFSYREDGNEAAFAVAVVEKIYAHESLTFNDTITCEVISKWKARLKDDMDAQSDVPGFTAESWYLLEGHSILSLEGSLSGDCDVEKNGKWSCIYAVGSQEYHMVCTILDIAFADVGITTGALVKGGSQSEVLAQVEGDQEDHKGEVFQVSNDDTAVDQRRLKDKLPEEKTNTDCLVKEQKKEYQTGERHSAWELFSYREDRNEAAFAVAVVEKIYAHESLTFNDTITCEVISKWKARLKDDMDARSDVCKAEIWATKGLLDKAKRNILESWYLLEGHSILSLEGSLSGDCDVEKNGKWSCIYAVGSQEYHMVCTILDIAFADVGMLDKFDRGLQTDV